MEFFNQNNNIIQIFDLCVDFSSLVQLVKNQGGLHWIQDNKGGLVKPFRLQK